jgi:hypothetical protein
MRVSNPNEIQRLFKEWSGANAQVWEYTCGHGTLLVRLYRGTERGGLFIWCASCHTVRFPGMGWKNVELKLNENANWRPNSEDFRFEIVEGEKFYVSCGGLSLIQSEKPIFIDWPPETRKKSDKYLLI